MNESAAWNGARFREGNPEGHYESWFQRANHPSKPQAFWIRYTVFVPARSSMPREDQAQAMGELWAVWFDGDTEEVIAVKEEIPLEVCSFSPDCLEVTIGDAQLDARRLEGKVTSQATTIAWSMTFESQQAPLLLLPRSLYEASFPKAKAMVGSPNAVFQGSLAIGDRKIDVDGWVGSQNHNWGSRHTDEYAWGQVAAFDGDPTSFLECSTARVRLGPSWSPFWSPWLTLMVLRVDGHEYRFNSIARALRAHGTYDCFSWKFKSVQDYISISGAITADRSAFVALPYRNPPGGTKTCLNSKIARCEVEVRKGFRLEHRLVSECRAAFEILTDDASHGVPRLVV